MKHLVIGGVRSGKSKFSEDLVSELAFNERDASQIKNKQITRSQLEQKNHIIYLATAQALDTGMEKRIAKHKARRSDDWQVIEEPLDVDKVLSDPLHENATILIDCITLWLTNVLLLESESVEENNVTQYKNRLLTALKNTHSNVVIVTSEVGQGIMPINALARQYADEMGELNQELAHLCDKVTLVCAGLPLALK